MQANHALKYKAGIAPQRKSKIKLSEYQKEFNWKQGKAASPLLTAEQVSRNYSGLRVHKLHEHTGIKSKKEKVGRTSVNDKFKW